MPCATFSRARKHDGLGPGPLRDSQHLWGLPHLGNADRYKLHTGNKLFLFTMRGYAMLQRIWGTMGYPMRWRILGVAWFGNFLCYNVFSSGILQKWCILISVSMESVGKNPLHFFTIIEGSLEVKLLTIWTDEKQSREEAERRERLEERRVEEKE